MCVPLGIIASDGLFGRNAHQPRSRGHTAKFTFRNNIVTRGKGSARPLHLQRSKLKNTDGVQVSIDPRRKISSPTLTPPCVANYSELTRLTQGERRFNCVHLPAFTPSSPGPFPSPGNIACYGVHCTCGVSTHYVRAWRVEEWRGVAGSGGGRWRGERSEGTAGR